MTTLTNEAQNVIARAQKDKISHIDLHFTDVTGVVKTVNIPTRQLEAAFVQGVWFDGSALEGFARVAESDMHLRPDPATYAILPWEKAESRRVARLICDVYTPTGDPFPGDPRHVLRRVVEAAMQRGYRYVVAPEIEFYLFSQPVDLRALQPEDKASYFDYGDTQAHSIRRAIVDALETMGILTDSVHHEVGDGQHEIDLSPLDALHMADAIMTVRLAVKAITREYGLLATFMPKPIASMAGSGMHVHQVLVDAQDGANCFASAGADYNLSEVGRSFLAGQLAHARGICAVLAPLVNSYKRMVAGQEAPVYITWAQLNRSALIRVPRVRADEAERVRIELRNVDPSCNPYLALAVMLGAGLDGIAQTMPLPPAAEEELYLVNTRRRPMPTLPTSLFEAIEALEGSELAAEALGLNVYERFREAKRMEWSEYVRDVSPWELQRYLTTY